MQAAQAAALSQPIVPGLIPVVSTNSLVNQEVSREPVAVYMFVDWVLCM